MPFAGSAATSLLPPEDGALASSVPSASTPNAGRGLSPSPQAGRLSARTSPYAARPTAWTKTPRLSLVGGSAIGAGGYLLLATTPESSASIYGRSPGGGSMVGGGVRAVLSSSPVATLPRWLKRKQSRRDNDVEATLDINGKQKGKQSSSGSPSGRNGAGGQAEQDEEEDRWSNSSRSASPSPAGGPREGDRSQNRAAAEVHSRHASLKRSGSEGDLLLLEDPR